MFKDSKQTDLAFSVDTVMEWQCNEWNLVTSISICTMLPVNPVEYIITSIWYDTKSVRQYIDMEWQEFWNWWVMLPIQHRKITEVRKVSLNFTVRKRIMFPIICFVIPTMVLNGLSFVYNTLKNIHGNGLGRNFKV